MIPVDYSYGGTSVKGYVSRPAAARPNRSMQNFFLNGRYVKSHTAMVALEEAFKGSLMVGKMPACVLHLTVSCRAVDVNVHPAKIEVRFVNEKPLFDCVYHGVKTALNQGIPLVWRNFRRRALPFLPGFSRRCVSFPCPSVRNHRRGRRRTNVPAGGWAGAGDFSAEAVPSLFAQRAWNRQGELCRSPPGLFGRE